MRYPVQMIITALSMLYLGKNSFVSSLAIHPYGGVLRPSKRKNLLVSDRSFSANRADERRGTRPRHAGAWRAEGNNADRCAIGRKNDGARSTLSADTVRGARRRKQTRWHPGPTAFLIIQRERIGNSRFLSWHYIAFAACGLFDSLSKARVFYPSPCSFNNQYAL